MDQREKRQRARKDANTANDENKKPATAPVPKADAKKNAANKSTPPQAQQQQNNNKKRAQKGKEIVPDNKDKPKNEPSKKAPEGTQAAPAPTSSYAPRRPVDPNRPQLNIEEQQAKAKEANQKISQAFEELVIIIIIKSLLPFNGCKKVLLQLLN